ncbi:MAG: hypothetical protein F6K39_10025 [Okeania sp. SIO3B3]|nr:hypothetical protein [Okeania sp. SIO3B3]
MLEPLLTDGSDRSPIFSNLGNEKNVQSYLIPEEETILATGERTTNFYDYESDLEAAFPTQKYETELDEILFTGPEIITTESTQNSVVLRSASQTKKDPLTGVEEGEQLVLH